MWQVVIENAVVHFPFEEPKRHSQVDDGGTTEAAVSPSGDNGGCLPIPYPWSRANMGRQGRGGHRERTFPPQGG